MAYEKKPLTGSAWRNESGQGKSAFSGTIKMDDGTEYWINLFNNQTKEGKEYFGITLNPKGFRDSASAQDQVPPKDVGAAVDDEVPF
jgi:hypothetical protein